LAFDKDEHQGAIGTCHPSSSVYNQFAEGKKQLTPTLPMNNEQKQN